ncbi:C4-dicarboxylate ABC transporter substrate-binding protein [Brevibacterium litoralis]|uniref:C4-dicarboxylate ABC transporter substrate-binding protein n=1 Tax=Brevibacterium litoralis TaxID=3138935 RepID=UPI0032EB6C90
MRSSVKYRLTGASAAVGALLLTAGCGGGVGGDGGADAGTGFAYGADQAEVDAALADLDPVTLTIQPYAASPDAAAAVAEQSFMDAVEERSGGKISFEIAWGQSIAPYAEVDDALVDGRLDVAYSVPIYFQQEYPRLDAYNKLSQYAPATPLTGEAALQAQMSVAGWNDEAQLAEYTDKGLMPLNPLVSSGNYWTACGESGTAMGDWSGRQIRIGGSVQTPISESLGASPVSMEYGEAFEALQRGTVDCIFVQGMVAGSTGLLEAAPQVSTMGEDRFTGAVTAGHVAGSGVQNLPLAYQQIIFDAAGVDWMHGQVAAIIGSSADAVTDVRDAGGAFTEMDSEAAQAILDTQAEIAEQVVADGVIEEEVRAALESDVDRWMDDVADLGLTDDGDLAELDEWYDPETDFRPLMALAFQEGALAHRPE